MSLKNLYKKIDATSKTRFTTSRRLNLHAKLSTYSIVLLSLLLILISLMQAYKIGDNISNDRVALIQIFSSVMILVYSLLIDKNDYSKVSEKMYSCASKLGKLKQKLYPYLDFDGNTPDFSSINKDELYENLKKEYHEILDLYETHSVNDFKSDYKIAKLEMCDNFPIKWWEHISFRLEIVLMYLINFSAYLLILSSVVYLFFWIW